jgi:hypothetical protein
VTWDILEVGILTVGILMVGILTVGILEVGKKRDAFFIQHEVEVNLWLG